MSDDRLVVRENLQLAASQLVRAVFGNLERQGAWVVPEKLEVSAIFASAVLDLRQARLSAAITEIDVHVVMSNLEIIVPPELAVDFATSTIFANSESHGAHAEPGRPLLRIRGSIIFGNLEVKTRLPGESEREARKRLRSSAARPMLPRP